MKKQIISIFAVCAMLALAMSGCGHAHQTDAWDADLNEHWKLCTDCGEIAESGEHTLDEANFCTVCGAEIADWGDSKSLYLSNEAGDLLKMVDYDADGTVTAELLYRYEYDSDGNLLYSTTTSNGVLTDENTYTTIDGERMVTQSIYYMDDGSKVINDYDEYGNVIRMISYDVEGNVDYQTESEYALSADGVWYEALCTSTEQDGTFSVGTFAETGDQIGLIRYRADGSITDSFVWEYTYDEDGNRATQKYYCNDFLMEETIYATVTSDDSSTTYPETVTDYAEDGSWTVTVFDENSGIVSQTFFAPDGKAAA